MPAWKKRILRLVIGTLILLSLVVAAAAVLAPRVIDSQNIRSRIEQAFAEQTGGELSIGRIGISFFPPGMDIRDVSIELPGTVSGKVESVAFLPELLPLLSGRLQVAFLRLDDPDIALQLPADTNQAVDTQPDLTAAGLQQAFAGLVAPAGAYVPNLDLSIRNAAFDLRQGDTSLLSLQQGKFELKLRADRERFSAGLKSSLPELAVIVRDKPLALQVERFRMSLEQTDGKLELMIDELALSRPGLRAGGVLRITDASPAFLVNLVGESDDVASLRTILNDLVGDIELVGTILDIVRDARIRQARFITRGATLAELGEFSNMSIEATGENATIAIPEVNLLVEDVSGRIRIVDEILNGETLAGRIGDSHGEKGALQLGLVGIPEVPFRLDIEFDADHEEVRQLLAATFPEGPIADAIAPIEQVDGRSSGRLLLGDTLNNITAEVAVETLQADARVRQVPLPLGLSGGKIHYAGTGISVEQLQGTVGLSSFSGVTGQLGWGDGMSINVSSGSAQLATGELTGWLDEYPRVRDLLAPAGSVSGELLLDAISLSGLLAEPEQWDYRLVGQPQNLTLTPDLLPAPLSLTGGSFIVTPRQLQLEKLGAGVLETRLALNGEVNIGAAVSDRIELDITGRIDEPVMRWLEAEAGLGEDFLLHTPLQLDSLSIAYNSRDDFSSRGQLRVNNGPQIDIEVDVAPQGNLFLQTAVKGSRTRASLVIDRNERLLRMQYSGNLDQAVFNRIFVDKDFNRSRLEGDFEIVIPRQTGVTPHFSGSLQGENLQLPLPNLPPLGIDRLSLASNAGAISVNGTEINWLDHPVRLNGSITPMYRRLGFELVAVTGEINWNQVRDAVREGHPAPVDDPPKPERSGDWDMPLTGSLEVAADAFSWQDFSWAPVRVQAGFDSNEIDLRVIEAELCDISMPMHLVAVPGRLTLDVHLAASDRQFGPVYNCLTRDEIDMTGTMNFTIDVNAEGQLGTLMEKATGTLKFTSTNGIIRKHRQISRLLEVVNVTEIVRGRMPDLEREAISYDHISLDAHLRESRINIDRFYLDSEVMDVIGRGNLHVPRKHLDLEFIVAPLKTVDNVVKVLPVINYILAGSLISIPVTIKGDLSNPKIKVVPASSVGKGLLGIAERTLKAPVKAIEPLVPK